MSNQKRRIPDTSKIAKVNSEHLKQTHYQKIIDALTTLQLANGYEIAKFMGMEHVQINRRLHEMRDTENPKIYRTEIKHATTPGNSGYCYAIIGVELPQSLFDAIIPSGPKVEKAMGEKGSIPEISRKIDVVVKTVQPQLF